MASVCRAFTSCAPCIIAMSACRQREASVAALECLLLLIKSLWASGYDGEMSLLGVASAWSKQLCAGSATQTAAAGQDHTNNLCAPLPPPSRLSLSYSFILLIYRSVHAINVLYTGHTVHSYAALYTQIFPAQT